MPVLDARALEKSLGTRSLLSKAFLTIEDNERVGLVGANGCGKSTLARILAGIDAADGGELAQRRDARILYLDQEPSFGDSDPEALEVVLEGLGAWRDAERRHREASAALSEGVDTERHLAALERAAHDVERLGGWEREHEARAMLEHLGVAHTATRKVSQLSGGERRRVALARLLVAQPDLAILDEPTNHLDVPTIEWLEQYLTSSFRGAVLLVTHDRWFLNQVVTRTLELERGELHSYEGGWEEYLEGKAERLAHSDRAEQNRQNVLRRELEWMRRTPAARTGKQKARIQRAESTIASGPLSTRDRGMTLSMETTRSGRTILELDDVSLARDGRTLVEHLELVLRKGDRIGILGPNGCGKTTLLKAILGELEPSAGTLVRGSNTQIAYLDQERSGLDMDASVADNVAPNSSHVEWAGRRMLRLSYLERLLFDTDQQRQPVSALSGGERARVLLARMLLQPANLLVLDEPTNDLDAPTLAALEELIVEADATAIVVTHDRFFLERVATAILAFEPSGRARKWAGSYSTYRSLRAEAEALATPEPAAPAVSAQTPASSERPKQKKKGLTWNEERELETLMEEIEAIESEIQRREDELADPGVYAERGAEVPALVAALEEHKTRLASKMTRWEALEAKRA